MEHPSDQQVDADETDGSRGSFATEDGEENVGWLQQPTAEERTDELILLEPEHLAVDNATTEEFNGNHDDDGNDDNGEEELDDNGLARYRCIGSIVNSWPRTTAFVCRIILPLWLLIGIAIGLGYLLGKYEETNEYVQNDEIVRERFVLKQFPINQTLRAMHNMSLECMSFYIDVKDETTNTTNADGVLSAYLGLKGVDNVVFPNVTPGFDGQTTQEILEELGTYIKICSTIAVSLADDVVNFTEANVRAEAFDDLTFNWIRCWNSTMYGGTNPFGATQEQVLAANNQSRFYTEAFEQDYERLHRQYLEELGCEDIALDDPNCAKDVFVQALNAATGSGICSVNTGGSAWFWFTVMTTVGYGNQSPVTPQGRGLVCGLGWLSIVAFGGISLLAGSVVAVVMDDFFKKNRLTFLTRPWAGAIFWAVIAILWLIMQSTIGFYWWNERQLGVAFTRSDSLWWSYISSTTVGLGDFFLAPEVIFVLDVFSWSIIFLLGFVFITTFLNKVRILLARFSSTTIELLQERLARTSPFSSSVLKYKKRNKKALHDINTLVDKMEEHGADIIDITLRKRQILIQLLCLTEVELADFSKFGSIKTSMRREEDALKEEESILLKILERTKTERRKMQESVRPESSTKTLRCITTALNSQIVSEPFLDLDG